MSICSYMYLPIWLEEALDDPSCAAEFAEGLVDAFNEATEASIVTSAAVTGLADVVGAATCADSSP